MLKLAHFLSSVYSKIYHFTLVTFLVFPIWESEIWTQHSVIMCSMFPRSTHETFAQKLYQTFKDHKRFRKPKLSRTDFSICHYAGEVSMSLFSHCSSRACSKSRDFKYLLIHEESWLQVTYQTELFLDKNKDYVVPEHQALLSASKCPFVSGLFPPLPEESSKSSKFSSIGSQFKVILICTVEC